MSQQQHSSRQNFWTECRVREKYTHQLFCSSRTEHPHRSGRLVHFYKWWQSDLQITLFFVQPDQSLVSSPNRLAAVDKTKLVNYRLLRDVSTLLSWLPVSCRGCESTFKRAHPTCFALDIWVLRWYWKALSKIQRVHCIFLSCSGAAGQPNSWIAT